jgi:putative peptide maturation dehydrogenase
VNRKEEQISEAELTILSRLPFERWLPISAAARLSGGDREAIAALIRKGLLLTNGVDKRSRLLRRRHDQLAMARWNPYAALYHFMGKWDAVPKSADNIEEFGRRVAQALMSRLERQGPPPPHFHRDRGVRATPLPLVRPRGGICRLLLRRRTDRLFDSSRALSIRDLATILYLVYGCQGLYRLTADFSVIKKTSPSGGSMHPIEVYPLVLRVRGLPPGLYHYRVADHSVVRLKRLALGEARSWALEFAAGQVFAQDAQVLFIMTARFGRTFWKYPDHEKAYRVILMDAAHLSQTFYLVCTDLGLGAFFTAAINEVRIERRLGVDDMEEGAIGISACGRVAKDSELRAFRHGPYTPRRAEKER